MFINLSRKQQSSVVVKLKGSLVAERCRGMADLFAKMCQQSAGGGLILNMQNVKALDASGVGVLVFILKRLKANGGSLFLSDVAPEVRSMLESLRLNRAIPILEETMLPVKPAVIELAA